MKMSSKTPMIIAASLLGIGMILLAAAAIASGGHILLDIENVASGDATQNYEEKEYRVSQDKVQEIYIDSVAQDIQVVSVPGDDVCIHYYESEKEGYDLTLTESGKLSLEYRNKGTWFHLDFFDTLNRDIQVLIELPSSYQGDLDFSAVSGDIKLDSCAGHRINLTSTSGNCSMESVSGESLTLSGISGDIKISQCEFSADIFCDTTSGDIQVGDSYCGGDGKFSSISGEMSLKDFTVDNNLAMETVSGGMTLSKIKTQDIRLSSTSGDIEASIVGALTDFSIQSSTTSGDCNLPDQLQAGDKELYVESMSGDIEINFTR